jgi:hypothetical protein
MSYIFLDESGDLGFDFTKPKTSKYFVITFLFATDKKPLEKIIKKIIRSFATKERVGHPGTLHAVKESPRIRLKLLNELARHDISILTIYLNKQKIYTTKKDEKPIFYNLITNILLDRIIGKRLVPTTRPIMLIASRRETNKYFNDNFKTYLESQIERNHKLKLQVQIKTPHHEKSLQVVDFAAWAIFRKHEYDDELYYNVIKSRVVEENPLYPL